MADYAREPWMNPAVNTVADKPSKMEGTSVKAVMIIGTDGQPVPFTGGTLTVDIGNKGATSDVTSVAASATSVTAPAT